MNRIRMLLVFVSSMAVIYLAVSFILWDFDPKSWDAIGRYSYVSFGAIISILITIASEPL